MKTLNDCYTLNNGVQIPCIGYGTLQIENGEDVITAVSEAIRLGYRHIDTAAGYQNEEGVGIAVKQSGLGREELFITSKLQNTAHGYEETMEAFAQTMKNLGMDYLDMYLVHWPNPIKYRDCWEEANAGTWRAFEELYRAGKIRAIGVSNFMPHHLKALMKTATITPAVNQIKLCPGISQDEAVRCSREMGILLEAYSPLGRGLIFESGEMQTLAEKYGKTIAQICIRSCLERGFLPLPKSATPKRMQENAEVFDFAMSKEDVDFVFALTGYCGEPRDPDTIEF